MGVTADIGAHKITVCKKLIYAFTQMMERTAQWIWFLVASEEHGEKFEQSESLSLPSVI
jgi:hypothetical protein